MNSLLQAFKTTLKLALPLTIALLAQKGLQTINTLMMGLLGANALAAAALSSSAYMMFAVIGIGLLNVVGVLISQAFGSDNPTEVRHMIHNGLYASLLLSLPCMLIIWFLPNLFHKLNQPTEIIALSADYLHTTLWGFPAVLGFFALREYVSALNYPRLVVIVSLLALPLNAFLSYCLMYGKFGLPVLHIKGIGYANTLTEWAMFFSLLFYITKHSFLSNYCLFSQPTAPDKKTILRIFRLGFPVGISYFLDLSMCAILAVMMGYFGIYALAAHQIAMQCISLVYMVPLGISFSMGLLVSKNLGAANSSGVFYTIFSGLLLGIVFTLAVIAVFLLYPDKVVNVFIRPDQSHYLLVKQIAVLYLGVAGIFVFFDMLQGILSGCLRGYRDTFVPMVAAILSFLVIGLGLGYCLAFIWHWEGVGLWWGLAGGLFAHSVFLSIRLYLYARNSRQKNQDLPTDPSLNMT